MSPMSLLHYVYASWFTKKPSDSLIFQSSYMLGKLIPDERKIGHVTAMYNKRA